MSDYARYEKQFKVYHVEFLKECKISHLVKIERTLSKFMESNFYDDSLFADEAEILQQLLHEECLRRLDRIAKAETRAL